MTAATLFEPDLVEIPADQLGKPTFMISIFDSCVESTYDEFQEYREYFKNIIVDPNVSDAERGWAAAQLENLEAFADLDWRNGPVNPPPRSAADEAERTTVLMAEADRIWKQHNGDFAAIMRARNQAAVAELTGGVRAHKEEKTVSIAAPRSRHVQSGRQSTDDDVPEIRPSGYSDDSIAATFSRHFESDLKYTPSWGWLEWDGKRWLRVADVAVMESARAVCRSVSIACQVDQTITPSMRDRLARAIASAKTVAAVERLARGDARHLTSATVWDSNLWLFNTPGGTIDLKTGTLRCHEREDRITKISNATPRGNCPRWRAFLDRITGGGLAEIDEERQAIQQESGVSVSGVNSKLLAAYLQRLAGYALVGDPIEECLDFFHGAGGNGKGSFIGTLQFAFGEYATSAPKETFAESKYDKHPCDIAKLVGARLVVSNEVDEGQKWDEARIKNLTGRDVMTARFMRQDFFDFIPQFTLIIAGNHRPHLKAVDESIRRRFHLVPFDVVIPPGERDPELKNTLRAEADGILAWAVAGCLEWQKQGLNPPASVLEATAEYLESEDTFEMWLAECCIRGTHHQDLISYLYESFRRWKLDRGEPALGQKTFSTRLTERGFTRTRNHDGWQMAGLRLNPEERTVVESSINDRRSREGKREWWNR